MVRNDATPLVQAGIPIRLEQYQCGCWGRHHPPRVEGESIIVEVGEGYRSNRHLHGQNLYVLDVDNERQVALVEMRKYGDLYGAGLWHYLIGVDDGHPFVAMVPARTASVQEALDYLIPAEVQRAIARGLDVRRQGDWFFVPVARVPRGEIRSHNLDGHEAAEAIVAGGTVYVKGVIQHHQHGTMVLPGWHKAVRNKALRPARGYRRRVYDRRRVYYD